MKNLYLQNKLITFSILGLLYIVPAFIFQEIHHLFVYYILVYMITGYGHFLLGFFYQLRSIQKKDIKTKIHSGVFYGCALVASILFFIFTLSAWAFFVVAFVNAYFLLHGAFNEATLYKRQTNKTLPRAVYFIPIALFLLYISSMSHFSAFFTYSFDFKFDNQYEAILALPILMQNLETVLSWAVIVVTLVGAGFLVDAILRKDTTSLVILLVTAIATVVALQTMSPIPFVLLLSLVLVYHFVTWAVFYFQEFSHKKNDTQQLNMYMLLTVLVHAVLIVIAVLGVLYTGIFKQLFNTVYFIPFFLSVTFMHITTSFLNESWYKKFFSLQ